MSIFSLALTGAFRTLLSRLWNSAGKMRKTQISEITWYEYRPITLIFAECFAFYHFTFLITLYFEFCVHFLGASLTRKQVTGQVLEFPVK